MNRRLKAPKQVRQSHIEFTPRETEELAATYERSKEDSLLLAKTLASASVEGGHVRVQRLCVWLKPPLGLELVWVVPHGRVTIEKVSGGIDDAL